MLVNTETLTTMQVPEVEPQDGDEREQEAEMGLVGSDLQVLKGKSFAACTPDEFAAAAPDHDARSS